MSRLFSGDIAENIRYSRPDSSDTECRDRGAADSFETVQHLPLGFRTPVNGGTDSSAGVVDCPLARSNWRRRTFLLLDEATARIDRSAEERLITPLTGVDAHRETHRAYRRAPTDHRSPLRCYCRNR